MENSVSHSWQRIEKWLLENAPADTKFFASGATETEIEEAEKTLNVQLPEDVRESYLLHNGAPDFNMLRIFEYGEFLSLKRMVEDWKIWKGIYDGDEEFRDYKTDAEVGIKNSWWLHGWIPFSSDGCGNSLCIDLDPAEGGISGQILELIHDDDSRSLHASSFAEWLSNYANSMEEGKVGFHSHLGVMPIHLLDL